MHLWTNSGGWRDAVMNILSRHGSWVLVGLLICSVFAPARAADRTDSIRGCRGTYASPPLGADGRADITELVKELVDLHANTYVWTLRSKATDWSDLKLFLPAAKDKGIRVWVGIYPPSE